jgi:GxxExxY protein
MGDAITEAVIGAALEVHRILGPGLLESIYEQALVHEMGLRGLEVQRQVQVDVPYKGVRIKGQVIDLMVSGEVIVELKSVTRMPSVATAQLLSYLRATGCRRGLLINFGSSRLVDGIKRISL